jgi:RimJ/RimL family protein N-acetyltransferase
MRMTNLLLQVRPLSRAEWWTLKAVRLRALRDSPRAFMSQYVREQTWDDHHWREQLMKATWIVAIEGNDRNAVGLARLDGGPEPRLTRYLESVWVDPTHRRGGVMRALVNAATDFMRQHGGGELLLWVLDDNLAARHAYTRLGFTPTGKQQPIAGHYPRFELQLALVVPG